jgi:hypothetical protein
MALRDIQTALGRLVRAPDGGSPYRSLRLDAEERSRLDALTQSAGFRFTVGVQRSWCVGRAMNAGYLTLSILPDDVRRPLLDEWTNSGGGTSSFFAAEADALLEFIANRLPDPSHELTACRLEQATLRANNEASRFTAPDLGRLDTGSCVLRRGSHAAMVLFYGDPDLIMPALLKREPLPPVSPEVTAVLFAPGLAGLCRPPSVDEAELWERLVAPVALADLVEEGYPREAMEAMLHSGAVEYGESPLDSIAHDL